MTFSPQIKALKKHVFIVKIFLWNKHLKWTGTLSVVNLYQLYAQRLFVNCQMKTGTCMLTSKAFYTRITQYPYKIIL